MDSSARSVDSCDLGDQILLQPPDVGSPDFGVFGGIAPPSKRKKSKAAPRTCEICGIVCNSEIVYEGHIKGQKHLKKLAALGDTSFRSNQSNVDDVRSGPSPADANAVLQHLNALANYNNTPIVFTTTGEPSSESNGGANCYEVKLVCGDQTFTAKGNSIREAQHIAAVMALDKAPLKRPPNMENVSSSLLDYSPNSSTTSIGSRFVAKRLFPINGYPSAIVCEQQFSRSRVWPSDPSIDKLIQKHLVAPTSIRHALHSLADYTVRTLIQAANSLVTHYRALNERRRVDKDLVEAPPALLDPVKLCQTSDEDYARLLWAVRVGPFTADLLTKYDHTVQIVVMCAQLAEDTDEAERAFVEEVRAKMPEAELSNRRLVLRRKQHNPSEQDLIAEIVLVGLRSTKIAPVELRRQLWLRQHLIRSKVALNALRVARQLCRLNHDTLGLLPDYTWQVLIGLVIDAEPGKQCPAAVIAAALSRLASGLLLNGGNGLADPCSDDCNSWGVTTPPVAGIRELAVDARIKVTKQAQKLLLEKVHPNTKSSDEILRSLLCIDKE